MDVALFVPCYVDQLFPRVGWAAVSLLERHGCRVAFLPDQTCCGQMHLNAGDAATARRLAERFARVFAEAEHVVAPSASCVATVRSFHPGLTGGEAEGLAGRCHAVVADGAELPFASGSFDAIVHCDVLC